MPSGRSGTSSSGHRANPQMVLAEDGYYYQERGGRTPYFFGSDGLFHPLIQIQDTTGRFGSDPEDVDIFLGLMMQQNNSFPNQAGEVVEFTRAIVITALHKSTAQSDPYSNLGVPHFGIQLTNDSSFAQDESTHMYHFRPNQPELSVFYDKAETRTDLARMRSKRHTSRSGKGNKKDPPGGGAGASSRSSKGGSSKEASSKGSSSKGTSTKGSSSKVTSSGGSSSKRHNSNNGSNLEHTTGNIHETRIEPRMPPIDPLPAECMHLDLTCEITAGESASIRVFRAQDIHEANLSPNSYDGIGSRSQGLTSSYSVSYARTIGPMCARLQG